MKTSANRCILLTCTASGYAGSDQRGLGPYEYHLVGNTFHVGSIEPGIGDETR